MKWSVQAGVLAAGLLLVAGCNGGSTSSTPPLSPPGTGADATLSTGSVGLDAFVLPANVRRSCEGPANEFYAQCDALVRTDTAGPNVSGLGPADFQSAYNLPSKTGGKGQTIAIVDAFDDPNAEADLAVYRSNFGLSACTTKNGCFRKVNQQGKPGPYPTPNTGWALEISLDVDMVSAACPNCHILLVEANDNTFLNLGSAVNRAVGMKADAVSNSYSASGDYKAPAVEKHYNHPGVIILAASGDFGYGPSIPGGFPSVVSVGGTTLIKGGKGRGWTETVWSGTGSGCEKKQPKPSWQSDKACTGRTQNDVAADASPGSGAAVYDTYSYPGWIVVGGTSLATPLLAGVYGLAGNESSLNAGESLYTNASKLYDVTSGTNGTCTPPSKDAYLCTGEVGYDGPTGNGTPNGVGAF